jgi:predicted HAD superfamily phosphohydrolase
MIQINIDCEGPITQNDNAFELSEALIPKGGEFFLRISRYDDYLADVEKRPGYKAGDTLRLILPFLRAFGATNKMVEEFSQKSLAILSDAGRMLQKLITIGPTFIISTSYRPYLKALSKDTGFPLEHIYCTDVDMDCFTPEPYEVNRIKDMASEITEMPLLSWHGKDTGGETALDKEAVTSFERLDAIFWKEIPAMKIGQAYSGVNPVGGEEKARAVEDSLKKTGLGLSDVIYAGDSITDVNAMRLVKQGGGTAISFNGNRYAIKEADIALIGESPFIIAAITRLIDLKGMGVISNILSKKEFLAGEALMTVIKENGLENDYIEPLLAHYKTLQLFKINKAQDLTDLIHRSERMRKIVRGLRVGALG